MKYYHVWFQTKFKKYLLVDVIDVKTHKLFRQIAEEKKVYLIASGSLPDHAHLLIGLSDCQELPWAIKMFKGISSRKLCQEFKLLRYELKTDNIWARKYGAREILEEDLPTVKNYVLNQKKGFYVF